VDRVTRHGFRFSLFALIGGGVFVAGLGLQVLLVRYAHFGPDPAYAVQAIFSIELSYLLNRHLTWRDRSIGWWAAAWKFNAQKLLMTVVSMAAFALLVRSGVEYVLANVLLTAIFTPVNYFAADFLVFARRGRRGVPARTVEPSLPGVLPTVSVVIPCKSSERTIRETVDSFLAQDYPELAEVILVGDVGDPTWAVLADITDPRLALIEQEKTAGRRDPNVKRDKGIKKSSGDVIALADSDIVVDPGWVGRAVALLNGQGGGLVAGGMRSIHDTFWGRFVDNNVLAAKTPRVVRPYQVTAESFGARGHKPPITANAVFTRSLYDACSLDIAWAYGYEDYEWFWRLAKNGHAILFSSELTAAHHHRRSFRHLVREYRQSAHGCAQFIRAHPDSPLARKRFAQAFGLPLGALGGLALVALAVADGHGALVAGLLAMATVLVTGREVGRARSLEGLTYPPAALALGGIYAASIAGSLMRPPERNVQLPTRGEERVRRQPGRNRISWPLAAILAAQSVLSLSFVWSNTAFNDEALYLWAGHLEVAHWLQGRPLPNLTGYFSGAPMIYPPIGGLADSLGGLAGARLLSLGFMLSASIFLYLTARRLFGQRTALVAVAIWVASEPAIKLSAFATYDPMSVALMALAAWLAIEAGHRRRRAELIAAAAIILVLASLTAYSYTIYVPAIIVLAAITWTRTLGTRKAVISAAWLAGATFFGLLTVPTLLKLWPGITVTVLARTPGSNSPWSVVTECWSLVGVAVSFGVVGVAAALAQRDRYLPVLLAALTGTALLVPFEQARIQSMVNVDKHLSLGVWFGAMAAAWGISALVVVPKTVSRSLAACGAAIALAVPLVTAWNQADGNFTSWPNTANFNTAMSALMPRSGPVLVENAPLAEYYSGAGMQWTRWTNISSNSVISNANSAQLLSAELIRKGTFGLVALQFAYGTGSVSVDEAFSAPSAKIRQQILKSLASSTPAIYQAAVAIESNPRYQIAAVGPYDSRYLPGAYVIWVKKAGARSTPAGGQNLAESAAR
jgi:putative flippase GtrA/GT2 family glycosyltransferase